MFLPTFPRGLALALALALIACILPASAWAEGSRAEWKGAALAGSERLFLYTLLKERPRGGGRAVETALRSQGFLHDPNGSGNWRTRLRGRPLLQYDDNINGGVPGDSFSVGAFEFAVDPESRAKSGMVVGASVQAGLSGSVGRGRVISLSTYGAALHSFDHGLSTYSAGVEGCLKSYAGSWAWIDACGGGRYYSEDLGVTRERYASLGLTRLVSSAAGSHEIRFDVRHSIFDVYEKTSSTVRVTSALPDLGALSMEIDVAEKVEGRNTHLWGVETSLAREIFGKRTVVSLGYDREGGSDFFGTPRKDQVVSVGVERDVRARLGISVGISRRFSSVDLYDESSVFLGFQVRGWSP